MKKLLLLATGAGIGYVLGARAGRPAYDRLVEATHQLGSTVGFDRSRSAARDVVSDARWAGEKLRDKADSRLAETVDKVGSVLPDSDHDGARSDAAASLSSPPVETRASDMANGF
jgi:hypothetical protein